MARIQQDAHIVRIKNTFLEVDAPLADLRREITCPGDIYPPAADKIAQLKKPTNWADMDSDDEDEWAPVSKCPSKCGTETTGDGPSSDCSRHSDAEEPEAEPARAEPAESPEDGWTTVPSRKKKQPRPTERQAPWSDRTSSQRIERSDRVERLSVGVVDSAATPVVRWLLGRGGSNLRDIASATGTTISLRGKGCEGSGSRGSERAPLHLVVQERSGARMPEALRRCTALLEAVRKRARQGT